MPSEERQIQKKIEPILNNHPTEAAEHLAERRVVEEHAKTMGMRVETCRDT